MKNNLLSTANEDILKRWQTSRLTPRVSINLSLNRLILVDLKFEDYAIF